MRILTWAKEAKTLKRVEEQNLDAYFGQANQEEETIQPR
jgi:hypothetical protein